MTPQAFLSLAVQTVTAPREVARLLLSLNLSRQVLGLCFGLVVVLNALVFSVADQLLGETPGGGLLGVPLVFFALQGLTLLATIMFMTWVGAMLGGDGRIDEVAVLLIWLQALRVLVQAILLVILPISAQLGALIILLTSAAGVWILINFIDEAHRFDNLFKAGLVLILGIFGMAIALSIVLATLGITPNGLTGYV